jgi:chromosome segregation ATPase
MQERLNNVSANIDAVNTEMQKLLQQRNQLNGQLDELSVRAHRLIGQGELLQSLITTELSEPESECEGGDNPSEE